MKITCTDQMFAGGTHEIPSLWKTGAGVTHTPSRQLYNRLLVM